MDSKPHDLLLHFLVLFLHFTCQLTLSLLILPDRRGQKEHITMPAPPSTVLPPRHPQSWSSSLSGQSLPDLLCGSCHTTISGNSAPSSFPPNPHGELSPPGWHRRAKWSCPWPLQALLAFEASQESALSLSRSGTELSRPPRSPWSDTLA